MIINTNVAANTAQRNLGITSNLMAKSVERLSSGLRINRAADDAAGLSITQKMTSQERGLAQGIRNAQDGVSMIQTAEGALDEVHNILQRARELGLQAANDTLTDDDRSEIQLELQKLQDSLNGIAANTKFNGKSLLNGNLAVAEDPTNPVASSNANITISKVDLSGAQAGATYAFSQSAAGASDLTLSVGTAGSPGYVSQTISTADISSGQSAVLNFDKLGITITLRATADVTAGDVSNAFAGGDFQTEAANNSAQLLVGYEDTATTEVNVNFVSVSWASLGLTGASAATQTQAKALVSLVDSAIKTVSDQRSSLGAIQNRLEHDIASLGVAKENITASKSRVLDLDVAAEMVQFTKYQILQQAGTAVLAQANQNPQTVLQLLR